MFEQRFLPIVLFSSFKFCWMFNKKKKYSKTFAVIPLKTFKILNHFPFYPHRPPHSTPDWKCRRWQPAAASHLNAPATTQAKPIKDQCNQCQSNLVALKQKQINTHVLYLWESEERRLYHVVLDFLKHVVVCHDELLGCVSVSNVGQYAQSLKIQAWKKLITF